MTTDAGITVAAEDGSTYNFGEKQKVRKHSSISPDGTIVTKFVFRNGAVRAHETAPGSALYARLAQHGADQKFGDEFAGMGDDVDDFVLAFEAMSKRFDRGEWSEKRESDGLAGTSMLQRALVEYLGKTLEEVKDRLSKTDNKVKAVMAKQPEVAAIINRLKAERDAKKGVKPEDANAALESVFGPQG